MKIKIILQEIVISLASFESENSFSVLHSDTEDTHSDFASPDLSQRPIPQSPNRYPKFPKLITINVNFQSVKNKITELHILLGAEKWTFS